MANDARGHSKLWKVSRSGTFTERFFLKTAIGTCRTNKGDFVVGRRPLMGDGRRPLEEEGSGVITFFRGNPKWHDALPIDVSERMC